MASGLGPWDSNIRRSWGSRDPTPEPLPDLTPLKPPHVEPIEVPTKKFSNSKDLIARFSNKMKSIENELKQQRELLLKDLPILLAWEERADAFIAMLNLLSKNGGVGVCTPEIKKEKNELHALLKKLKSEASLEVLEGYVKKDLTLWVKPLSCLPFNTTSYRVSLASDIKDLAECHADKFYSSLVPLRPLYEQLKSKYHELENKLATIFKNYAILDEIMSDFRVFKKQVEETRPEIPPASLNVSTPIITKMSHDFSGALVAWERADLELINMREQIALLSEWLYNPEMPNNSDTVRNINSALLTKLLKDYADKKVDSEMTDVSKTLKDLNESPKETKKTSSESLRITLIDSLKDLLVQLKATPNLPVSVEGWVRDSVESAIKRLEVKRIEVEQTSLRYLSLKKRAKEKVELLQNLQGFATNELPVVSKHFLRNILFPNVPVQASQSKGGSYLFYFLSLPFSYLYSSTQKVGKHPINPDDPDNKEVWVTRTTVDADKLLSKFKLNKDKFELLYHADQRALERLSPPIVSSGIDHCRAYALKTIREDADEWLRRLNIFAAHATQYDIRLRLLLAVASSVDKLDKNSLQRQYWNELFSNLCSNCDTFNLHFRVWKNENSHLESRFKTLEICIQTMLSFQNSLLIEQNEQDACWATQEYVKQMMAYINDRRASNEHVSEMRKLLRSKESTFGPENAVVSSTALRPVVDWLPVKPMNLRSRLNISVGAQGNPAELLKTIEAQLVKLEKDVSTHEVEKLKYHEDKFQVQSAHVDRFINQIILLIGNIEFLDKFASTVLTIYKKEATFIPRDKVETRQSLQNLLDALIGCHQLVAQDVKAFRPMISRAKELLVLLVEREKKKQTDEKVKWRAEQSEVGLRKQLSNDKRLQQLKQAEAFYSVALIQVEELWKMAKVSYLVIPPKIQEINVKLHGEWKGYYYGYVAESLTVDPFSFSESLEVPIQDPAPSPLIPPDSLRPPGSEPIAIPRAGDEDPNSLSDISKIADGLITSS